MIFLPLVFLGQPSALHAETLTCAGGDTMVSVAKNWAEAVIAERPGDNIHIRDDITLSADGFKEFMDGRINCILFVREPFKSEYASFEARHGHPPLVVPVGGGSFKTRGSTHAIGVFVHRDNPLQQLNMQQLDALLSGTRLRGSVMPVRVWGDLGLSGEWKDEPVRVYGMLRRRVSGDPPGIMNFLQNRVLLGGEFRQDWIEVLDNGKVSSLQGIVNRVGEDRFGIGLSGFANITSQVRTIPIADRDDVPVEGRLDTTFDQSYPLSRRIYLMVTSDAKLRPSPLAQALLSEALSERGQAVLAQSKEGFLPLPDPMLRSLRQFNLCPAGLPFYHAAPIRLDSPPAFMDAMGKIRIVGYNDMLGMFQRWNSLFHLFHPSIQIKTELHSTRSAPPALEKGHSLLAPMGAPFEPDALRSYRNTVGHDPLPIEVAHASLAPNALSGPIGIFVHERSPLTHMTLKNLRGLLAGYGESQLSVVGLREDTALGRYILERLNLGHFGPLFRGYQQSRDVISAIAADENTIGFASAQTAIPGVRALALSSDEGAAFVPLSVEHVISGAYPLDRKLMIYGRVGGNSKLHPIAKDYLNLVLSCQGQQMLSDDERGYMPLNLDEAVIGQEILRRH